MCCQKLVIAQKYSAEVRRNFSIRSAPSAKTLAEHYKGMFGAPLLVTYRYSLFGRKWSPIQALTWPSVE